MARWTLLLAGIVALAVGASSAQASFKGTPGKVAHVDSSAGYPLKVWDPVTNVEQIVDATTWQPSTQNSPILGFPSAPSWSPDGRYLAYTKQVTDPGDVPGLRHTTIWVWDVKTGSAHQLTTPPASFKGNQTPPPETGHTAADWAPAFSADGNSVYFIRQLTAGKDDSLYGQRGQNVWKVPVAGGTGTEVTDYTDPKTLATGVVAVPETLNLVVGRQTDTTHDLVVVGSSGGTGATLASGSGSAPILDYDVSPDGQKVMWSQGTGGGFSIFVRDVSGGTTQELPGVPVLYGRYSNDGSGVLHPGVSDRGVQGLSERLVPDPEADIAPDETERMTLPWTGYQGTVFNAGFPERSAFDVQAQTLPIVFAPGFLGSIIGCDGATLWPITPQSADDLLQMRLNPDGDGNFGCGAAAPTGDLVETAFGKSIYKPIADFLRTTFPNGRSNLFGWDWRRRPQPQTGQLDLKIDAALAADGPWKDQGAGRVVLIGHSYGGLLIRTYIKQHPEKVARVLTLGTPYWGSPKAVFPLAFGIESPDFSPLDLLLDNDALKALAVNLAGLYQLYPSAAFGQWLTLDGTAIGPGAGAAAFVTAIGGNGDLETQAAALHDSDYEGFYDNQGKIDVRAVVGTGVPTIGSVQIIRHLPSADATVFVHFTNGDGTVPARSAAQGTPGAGAPKGDPVHRQYTCGVEHVSLGGDLDVLAKYRDFIDFGAVPRKLAGVCSAGGGFASFSPGTLGVAPAPTGPSPARDAAPPELGLDDAENAGLIDVLRFPANTYAVFGDGSPVTLRVQITGGTFEWHSVLDDKEGPAYVFGPLTGTVRITAGTGAPLPDVTVDGTPVTGQPLAGGGGSGGSPPPAGGGPGGSPPPGGSTALAPPTTTTKLHLIGRPQRRGRRVTLKLALPGRGTLALAVVSRRRTLARLRRAIAAAATRTFTLTARRAVRRGARLTVRFTAAGKKPQTLAVSLR